MVQIEKISPEEAEEAMKEKTRAGQWTELLSQIEEDGVPRKVSGLTRGQIAALYRRAKDEGFAYRTSYKDGYIIIAPVPKGE